MWFKIKEQIVELNIYVKPKAKKTALLAICNDELHISLHAKPQDGEANKELISFLARFFKVPKTQTVLLRGATSRHKQIKIPLNDVVRHFLNNPSI